MLAIRHHQIIIHGDNIMYIILNFIYIALFLMLQSALQKEKKSDKADKNNVKT